jgi:CubicO group peptidase (beta-lactamase class C family)
MKLNLFAACFTLCITTATFSQSFDSKKLDRYLETLESHNKFMGSVAISKNNAIIYSKTVGFQNMEDKTKADNNTIYSIGSISKTFTAALVLKAVEQKKVSLNTTIDKFFPSVTNAKKITVENLLNHSSGIGSFTDNADYLSWHTQPKSEKEMLEIITKTGSYFEPDTKSAYSNSNYVLLSYILEHIYKKKYSEILTTYIIKPLQLKNTYFEHSLNTAHEAISYTFSTDWDLQPNTEASIPMGAGAIQSNAADLVKFSDALFNGKIISKESIAKMKTLKNDYGLGLFDYSFEKHTGIGHDGAIDGYKSIFTNFENDKISYAITSNATNYKLDLIANIITSAAFGMAYEIPEFKAIHITPEELEAYTGVYSAEGLPFKITITRQENTINAQATGQAPLPLEATDKNVFTFDKAGIQLTFRSDAKMILKQSGREIEFKKE